MVAYLEGYIDHMKIRQKFHTNMNVTSVTYNHAKGVFEVETTHNLTAAKLVEGIGPKFQFFLKLEELLRAVD